MRASIVCVGGLVVSLLPGAERALAVPSNPDFRIPVTEGQQVDSSWKASRPGVMKLLTGMKETMGADWIVYWDDRLETPRYLAARVRPVIVQGPLEQDSLIAGATGFIEANRDFFGVSSLDLLEPVVYDLHRNRLVIFRQGSGGIPIRGTSLRVLIDLRGAVASVDAFLLRRLDVAPVQYIDENDLLARARSLHEAHMGALERQVLFPTEDPGSAVPGWCLEAEYPDGRTTELFFDAGGSEIGEVDLAQHFEGSIEVQGFSTDPADIYLPANQADGVYPIPDIRVFVSAGWRGFTDEYGFAVFESPWKKEKAFTTLELGISDASPEPCLAGVEREPGEKEELNEDRIRTMLGIYERFNCTPPTAKEMPVILSADNMKPVDLFLPIQLTFNAGGLNGNSDVDEAFRLLAYHNIRGLHNEFMNRLENIHLETMPTTYYFPIRVGVVNGIYKWPSYIPRECDSYICMSAAVGSQTFIPPTIVQHEYSHHVIHTMVTSRRYDDFVDGLADVITAFKNEIPKIGYIAEEDPGTHGFRLDEPTNRVSELRGKVGRTFWKIIDKAIKETKKENEIKKLLYMWIAQRRVSTNDQIAFEPSRALLEQLMVADDSIDGGNGDILDGVNHIIEIKAGFEDWGAFNVPFIRGDVDQGGGVDLTDVIAILSYLFLGGTEDNCLEAMDADDNNAIQITDPLYLLRFQFLGDFPPKPPFPDCGIDADQMLWCWGPSGACSSSP